MSSDNNNISASLGNITNLTKGASTSITEISDTSDQSELQNSTISAYLGTSTNVTQAAGAEATKTVATASAEEVEAKDTSATFSTLSLTDTTIYTTYSLAQLDAWITAYHAEAALVTNKIRPLTTAETAILTMLLTQRRGVENSMIYKEKYEEFIAKEKAKRCDDGN